MCIKPQWNSVSSFKHTISQVSGEEIRSVILIHCHLLPRAHPLWPFPMIQPTRRCSMKYSTLKQLDGQKFAAECLQEAKVPTPGPSKRERLSVLSWNAQ